MHSYTATLRGTLCSSSLWELILGCWYMVVPLRYYGVYAMPSGLIRAVCVAGCCLCWPYFRRATISGIHERPCDQGTRSNPYACSSVYASTGLFVEIKVES